MKVKWTGLVDDLRGHVDRRHYARHIPGNYKEAAVCQKPELSEKTRKYNKPIQGRLCDFVRHHVSLALKEGREIE